MKSKDKKYIKYVIYFLNIFIYFSKLNSASIEIKIRNIIDNSINDRLEYNVVRNTISYCLSNQYLEIIYEGYYEYPLWKISIYTNNNIPELGYQKSGLIHETKKTSRVPLVWKIFDEITNVNVSDPSIGDWRWVKDKNDIDDPNTTYDESWTKANEDGYNIVCYGNKHWSKLADNTDASSPIYLYLEAVLSDIFAGVYMGNIYFDMYPVIDIEPPIISHEPLGIIFGSGNNVEITAKLWDDREILDALLFYKIDNYDWQTTKMNLLKKENGNYIANYIFNFNDIKDIRNIFYGIEVTDGYNKSFFKDKQNPQKIEIADKISFFDVKEGTVRVPDGNPNDGETFLSIPSGALDKPIMINIALSDLESISDENISPVIIYNLEPANIQFRKPVLLELLYYDKNDNNLVELPNGTETQINENDLKIYHWNGSYWKLLSSNVNTSKNTISASIINFGKYAIVPKKVITLSDIRPKEKIITPSLKDGKNDIAFFNGLSDSYEIKIFDINGKRIKKINPLNSVSAQWDGTDEDGNIVESGLYIYQVKIILNGEEKIINGTIAVAK